MFKEIADPLYGFVRAGKGEIALIDSPVFQRLRGIRQLGPAFLVFPSANHTRFEHSLGVMHLTESLLKDHCRKCDELEFVIGKLSALLHDIGHAPFSHTGEFLLPEDKNHEDMASHLILETEIFDILRREFSLSIEDVESLVRIVTGKPSSHSERRLSDLLNGPLGTDRMDYLKRDAFFCGVSYGLFESQRLLSTLEMVDGEEVTLAVDISGLRAFENFIIGRYFMYLQVYFHRVVRILNIHMVEALRKILSPGEIRDPFLYLKLTDSLVMTRLQERKDLSDHFRRVFGRDHFKEVFSTSDSREFRDAKGRILESFPEDLVRFDTVYKEVLDGPVMVINGDSLVPAREISQVLASLKPIEIFRIYVHPSIRDEACGILRKSA